MPKMTLHIINARHQLSGIADWLSERLDDAFAVSAKYLPLRDTDVILRAGKAVIPEKGHLGYAPESGLIYVTVDPKNPAFRANSSQSLERMLAHELHHSSRWDGPGYGKTLGEALVSEGLAGHFAQEAYGGEREPWEQLSASTLRPYFLKAQEDWQRADYNHDEWFFGSQEFPAWVGYSLGYELVGHYLAAHGDARASNLAHADAADFWALIDAV
ncbi:DUF2268 domain-containing protein [Pseudomonas sp. GX19020]|uniref:DUF2268 domain-containing putative Zn-dependent protease n=1 Tax=Pseudomonas sp. GX19020 TaxID=2942277 RepID=UPI002019488C|nr:DUF2268 domain-containing putative Zn-dependent protease [Pseudomonas sp. GX19020]MCL4069404.1 DUF2268 domain-containing protein [Pseudomonas sp. GX19020]